MNKQNPIYKTVISINESSRQVVTNTHRSWVRFKRSCKKIMALFLVTIVIKKLIVKIKKSWTIYSAIRLLVFTVLIAIRRKDDGINERKNVMIEELKM